MNTPLTILFADVSGSSKLFKALGDNRARFMISEVVEMMKQQTTSHQGRVIKTIGDEVMAAFTSAEHAFNCARLIQQTMQSSPTGENLSIRIGMHTGPVIEENNDLFGETVNDAAAIVGIAKGKQILTSEFCTQQLPSELQLHCEAFDHINLKGSQEKSLLFRIQWEEENAQSFDANATYVDVNILKTNPLTHEPNATCLTLAFASQVYNLSAAQMPFSLGRQMGQDISLPIVKASREHCHIDYKRGKFVLVDHSSNGTLLQHNLEKPVFLRREEAPLTSVGRFYFELDADEIEKVAFQVS